MSSALVSLIARNTRKRAAYYFPHKHHCAEKYYRQCAGIAHIEAYCAHVKYVQQYGVGWIIGAGEAGKLHALISHRKRRRNCHYRGEHHLRSHLRHRYVPKLLPAVAYAVYRTGFKAFAVKVLKARNKRKKSCAQTQPQHNQYYNAHTVFWIGKPLNRLKYYSVLH